MNNRPDLTTQIEALIDRLMKGDESARVELVQCTWDRLLKMTRQISRDYPPVRRWAVERSPAAREERFELRRRRGDGRTSRGRHAFLPAGRSRS